MRSLARLTDEQLRTEHRALMERIERKINDVRAYVTKFEADSREAMETEMIARGLLDA